jgi:integrase
LRKQLTEQGVARLSPPKAGRVEVADKGVLGLVFRVTDRGVRSWSLLYRIAGEGGETASGLPKRGKLRRLTLGRYPVLDLKKAREAAREALELADGGQDPAIVRASGVADRQRRRAQTVARVVEDCLEKHYKHTRKYETAKAYLEGRVVSQWGNRPMASIKRRDAIALLDDIKAEGKPGAATDVLKYGRKLFNWAIDREDIGGPNPFDRLKPPKSQPRDRSLKPAEIAVVWDAADRVGYPFGPLVQLLLVTGCRRTEIAAMRWSWFDLEADTPHFEIPAEHYKSERAHVVPLSSKAQAVIAELPRFRGDYVLTTTHGRRPISGYSKMKKRLDDEIAKSAIIDPWCLHDLRRTVYTHLTGRCKVSEVIADRVLGHAMPGLQRVYNQYRYFDEKAEALEGWANDLTTMIGERNESVRVLT